MAYFPNCFHCVTRLELPTTFEITLIGMNKKTFFFGKKDTFDFCQKCFEYFFGNEIIFSTNKEDSMACHVCNSKLISSFPYSYFHRFFNFKDHVPWARRRLCGQCSALDLFPILSSLIIVAPP